MKQDSGTADALLVHDFRKSLRVLEREVQISMSSDTDCCGVSLAQCHLLLEVELRGASSVTELASILSLDKSTMSRTAEALVTAGLLNRETVPDNRRQQIISLTKEGKAKAQYINRTCDSTYTRLLDFIPARRRASVMESVTLLADAMRRERRNPRSACCSGTADGGKEI
jgi:DNA-binding MarR family transcriptional regulator